MSPRPSSPHSMSPSSTRVSSPAKSKPSDLPSPPPQSPTGEASGPTLSSPRTPSTSQENVATQEKPMLQDQTNLLPFKQVVIVFAALSIALFVTLLDQTMVSTALPTIGENFGETQKSTWVATSYLLTSTAFQPLYGRFSDIFGRKYTLLFALSIFVVGSLGSALSQTMIQLIVTRAISGMGGGAIITLVMIIVSDVVSLKERGKYQGVTGTIVVLSNSLGPLIGGAFTQKASWRWCFWINLPLGILSIIVVIFFLPIRRVTGSWKDKIKKVDYLGGLLILAGAIALLIPISWGGTEHAWGSAAVIVPLVIAFLIFAAFVFVETKVALPIVPMHIFKIITVCGVIFSTMLSGCIFYIQLFYLPQFFQVVLGTSTLRSGVLLLALIIPQTFASFASGWLVSALGEYRYNLMVGFTIWTVGVGLLSTLHVNSGLGKIVGYQVLTGIGAGGTFQAGIVAIQAAVPRDQMAVVTAMRNFVRLLGGTISLAVGQALLNNAVQNFLISSNVFTTEQIKTITSAPTQLRKNGQFSTSELEVIIQAYTRGISHVWYWCIPCAGLSLVLVIFCIKHHSLTREDDGAQKEAAKEWAARHKLTKEQRHALDLEKGLATPGTTTPGGGPNMDGFITPGQTVPGLSGKERRSLERAVERGREEDLGRRLEEEYVDGAKKRKEEKL